MSSLARCGFSWRGKVLRGRAQRGEVLHGRVRHGFLWRGMASFGTVMLCGPVLCGKAWLFEACRGVAGWSPDRLGQAVLGKLRRLCCADRRGKLLHGIVLFGKVLLWSGEALLGVVGLIGALYSKVRSYRGMVWSREALHCIAKFGPVKHGVAKLAKALFWRGWALHGFVLRGSAGQSLVNCGKVLFWKGGAGQSDVLHAEALLRQSIGWASLVIFRCGMEWWGGAKSCTVM